MGRIILFRATLKETPLVCPHCGRYLLELCANELYLCEECDEIFSMDELERE